MRIAESLMPDSDAAASPSSFISRFSLSPDSAAYLWTAMEVGCSMVVVGESRSDNTDALCFLASFIQATGNVTLIRQNPNGLPIPSPLLNTTSFYYSGSNAKLKSAKVLDALSTSSRLILDEVHRFEANALFIGSRNHVPFVTTVCRNGNISLVNRLTNEAGLKISNLNRLDLSMHLFSGTDKNICNVMEYHWLSRAEIPSGEKLGNGDSVRILDTVSNGAFEEGSAMDMKAIKLYSKINGLADSDALKELKSRASFIEKLQSGAAGDFIESVRAYSHSC